MPGCTRSKPEGRQNLISTIKALAKTHKYIVFGDTNHTSVEVREMLADPTLLKAISDSGIKVVIKEGDVSQNQGFDPIKYPADPAQMKLIVPFLQDAILAEGISVQKTDTLDLQTWNGIFEYVKALKTSKYWGQGWTGDDTGFYSYEFLEHLKKKLQQTEKQDGHSDSTKILAYFVNCLAYIKDTGQARVPTTSTTDFQEICEDGKSVDTIASERVASYHADRPDLAKRWIRAETQFLASLCAAQMKVFYPDENLGEMSSDPEVVDYFATITERASIDDVPYLTVMLDAELRAKPELKRAAVKLEKYMKDRLSERVNGHIAENGKKLSDNAPAIFIYGSGHLDRKNDIDEMLGQDQTATIILIGKSREQIVEDVKNYDPSKLDLPEFYYNVDSDDMVAVKGSRSGETSFRSRFRTSLTRQEYNDAVRRLPAELKPFAMPYSEYDGNPSNNVFPENWLELDASSPAVRQEPGA